MPQQERWRDAPLITESPTTERWRNAPLLSAETQQIPPDPGPGLSSMTREAVLGLASGTGLPETTHAADFSAIPGLKELATNPEAWKALGESLYESHANQFRGAKEAWQAGGVEGVGSALVRGAAGLVPFVGPAAEQTGEALGNARDWNERMHAGGQAVGLVGTLGLGTKPGQVALKAGEQAVKTAATKTGRAVGEQLLTAPQTVRREVTQGALNLLKKAQKEAFADASQRYPKLRNADFVKEQALRHFPEESIYPGVKAIKEKLLGDHPNAPFGEQNIRNARAEAWTYIRRNLPRDEQVAYQKLYDAMTSELRNVYAREGRLAGFERAEKNWAKVMDTFKAPDSPIFKALEAERVTGEFEPSTVSRALGGPEVAKSQLQRMTRFGVPKSLSKEMRLLEYGRGLSDPTVLKTGLSFTAKVPILREALAYILTRPKWFPSLQLRAAQEMAKIEKGYIPRTRQLTGGRNLSPPNEAGPPNVQGAGMVVHPGTRASRTGRLLPAAGETTRKFEAQPVQPSGAGGDLTALQELMAQRSAEFPRPTVSGLPARRYQARQMPASPSLTGPILRESQIGIEGGRLPGSPSRMTETGDIIPEVLPQGVEIRTGPQQGQPFTYYSGQPGVYELPSAPARPSSFLQRWLEWKRWGGLPPTP